MGQPPRGAQPVPRSGRAALQEASPGAGTSFCETPAAGRVSQGRRSWGQETAATAWPVSQRPPAPSTLQQDGGRCIGSPCSEHPRDYGALRCSPGRISLLCRSPRALRLAAQAAARQLCPPAPSSHHRGPARCSELPGVPHCQECPSGPARHSRELSHFQSDPYVALGWAGFPAQQWHGAWQGCEQPSHPIFSSTPTPA